MTVEELDVRSVNHFNNPDVDPNDWFDGYEEFPNGVSPKALNLLGYSYRTDTVHLDFSPRATVARSTMGRRLRGKTITKTEYGIFGQRYRAMVATDLPWFLSALKLCRKVKAAVMAGTVGNDPQKDYLDTLLQTHLPPLYSLKLRQCLDADKKYGATALYELTGPDLNVPVFFVSASPSYRNGGKGVRLAKDVQRNLCILKKAGFAK
jgi:hypothetical protein